MKDSLNHFVQLLVLLMLPSLATVSGAIDTNDVSTATASPSPPSATALPEATREKADLAVRDLPEIHSKISLPGDWNLLLGKLNEGGVLLATREKITSESDPWNTGLSMTVDRSAAKDSGQKASAYALGLAGEARDKAGDEASPIVESDHNGLHELRFSFPVPGEEPLLVTELLLANDETGTVTTVVWQMPANDSGNLQTLRDAILVGLQLDPAL